jgi:hypothetical protein
MKVTIDNLVGSAGRIQSQRASAEKNQKTSVKGDSAEIASKVDSRLVSLEGDMRASQTELSKNQVIQEGISKAIDDLGKGKNPSATINAVTFNDKKVLLDFLGDSEPSKETLFEKGKTINDYIKESITKITRLQVEAENIQASNLTGGKDIESSLKQSLESTKLSDAYSGSLNADAVRRLIR